MSEEYYGPTPAARERLEQLLGLRATGREQDWEIEFADPARIRDMLRILDDTDLDNDERSALSALTLHSLEEAAEAGIKVNLAALELRNILSRTPTVRERMRFYWKRMEQDRVASLVLR
jgi:hypothetical protein